ncbi:MAG TPA: MFS transporter [Streptosporangiales bacterium]
MSKATMTGRERAALLLITAVELVVALDTTVVNIALPAIGHDLRLGEAQLGWVANAYLLAFGGFMLLGGRLVDRLGPRRTFRAGLAAFTVASALAGLAPSAGLLIAARAVQGVAAAVVIPAQISLLAVTFTEPDVHRRAFGVWSAMGAAGSAAGTAVGGLLTQAFGWPAIFLVNLPIGAAAVLLAGRLVPSDGPAERGGRRLDLAGALVGTTALLVLGYAVGAFTEPAMRLPAVALSAGAIGLLGAFVAIEARAAEPLLPLRLFRVGAVSGSAVLNVVVGAAHVPAFTLLSLYLQHARGYTPVQAGLAFLPVALTAVVVGRVLVPAAHKRLGGYGMLAAGLALQALAFAWFGRLPAAGGYLADVLPGLLLLATGIPATAVGGTVPAVDAVGKSDTGVVAGVVNTTQRVGAGLGVAALLTVAATVTGRAGGPADAAYVAGLRASFLVCTALALVGCVLTVFLLWRRRRRGAAAEDCGEPRARREGVHA